MQKFDYKIKDPEGLHARPAGLLAKCVQECASDVTVSLNGKTANAKRLFAVMGLGVRQNDKITISVEGPGESEDTAKIKAFCEANL